MLGLSEPISRCLLTAAFTLCPLAAVPAFPQKPLPLQNGSGSNVAASKGSGAETPAKLVVAFRVEDWKAAHFADADKAAQHADVLTKLGCEVKTVPHAGHTDVQCKTTVWKSLALDDAAQVAQWTEWFNAFGFDTIHGRVASAEKPTLAPGEKPKEIVQFRLLEWKTLHAHQPQQFSQLLALYRALNCEIQQVDHNGHQDLRVRCPAWMEMELPTHHAAHQWQEFLRKASFETKHEH